MSSQIWYTGEYSVQSGKVEEFKRLIQHVIDQEHSADADVLVYEFFSSDDENTFRAIESYEDSDAVLSHLERFGEVAAKILDIAELTHFEIYGN